MQQGIKFAEIKHIMWFFISTLICYHTHKHTHTHPHTHTHRERETHTHTQRANGLM